MSVPLLRSSGRLTNSSANAGHWRTFGGKSLPDATQFVRLAIVEKLEQDKKLNTWNLCGNLEVNHPPTPKKDKTNWGGNFGSFR